LSLEKGGPKMTRAAEPIGNVNLNSGTAGGVPRAALWSGFARF
jgi:hypothetical protein